MMMMMMMMMRVILFNLGKIFLVGHSLLQGLKIFFTIPEIYLVVPEKIAKFMIVLRSECF